MMLKETSPLPLDDRIMSERECAGLLGLAETTLTNMRRAGTAPPYFRVSGHVVRYSKTRVLEWLQSRSVEGAEVKQIENSKESKP
ncbi:helix-turn-helix transcriptional regulator [Candidatus Binatus soli]|jgi:predicted DNA-binding transcriptional regulator AlpA|uniref:helix-turn-helix transcriptional regulator n=1 Tax=Candidatus Binatus soli TaxID=1953413 RepID=UPI003D14F320